MSEILAKIQQLNIQLSLSKFYRNGVLSTLKFKQYIEKNANSLHTADNLARLFILICEEKISANEAIAQ